MANRRQPERWESTVLAGWMAVVGTIFLFDKLGPLFRVGAFSFSAVLHAAPMLVLAFAVSLIVVDGSVGEGGQHGR